MRAISEPNTVETHRRNTEAPISVDGPQALNPELAADVYGAVYAHLKRMARRQLSRESPFTDLSATVLVHESYARAANLDMPLDRSAFFGYAARVMRSVVVDYVRARQRAKRDGIEVSLTVADDIAASQADHNQIISVDRALTQLEVIDKRAHDLVELRYFGGLTLDECAAQLGISEATATRDWRKARAFLCVMLSDFEQ